MFNPDPSSKHKSAKLPKAVIMMVEKNNLVMAIKTLAQEENISMDEAKTRIDAYENQLKVKQQQKLNTIANKQGISNKALSFDREHDADSETSDLIKSRVKTTPAVQDFDSLQTGVNHQLDGLGYKKPLLPYWAKRLLIMAIVMAGIFWILWRVFGT